MKFVEQIIVALVQESKGPLDQKKILEDAAEIVRMEAVRCECSGNCKRAIKLWKQHASCLAAARNIAEDANSFLSGAGGRH